MSTYSGSETVGVPQSAEEGAAFAGRPLSLPTSFLVDRSGLSASAAWVIFGLSCLWWQDLGEWSRTQALAVAAFVVAGGILVAAGSAVSEQA
jgi:NitT/TauT family transport system permease protein